MGQPRTGLLAPPLGWPVARRPTLPVGQMIPAMPESGPSEAVPLVPTPQHGASGKATTGDFRGFCRRHCPLPQSPCRALREEGFPPIASELCACSLRLLTEHGHQRCQQHLWSSTGPTARRGTFTLVTPGYREPDMGMLRHHGLQVGTPACVHADAARKKFADNQRIADFFPRSPTLPQISYEPGADPRERVVVLRDLWHHRPGMVQRKPGLDVEGDRAWHFRFGSSEHPAMNSSICAPSAVS